MRELTEAHILSVRRLHDKGLSIAEIMDQTSLSNGCIRRILGVKKCMINDERTRITTGLNLKF